MSFPIAKGASIGWGNGSENRFLQSTIQKRGSAVRFQRLLQWLLSFNFRWLHDNENTEKYLDGFAERLAKLPGIVIPPTTHDSRESRSPEVVSRGGRIMESLKHLIEDAARGQKAPSPVSS